MKYIYIILWIVAFLLVAASEHGAAGWTGAANFIIGAVLLGMTLYGVYGRR